ncbi:MAG: DUF4292 domain-containing protein [Bacteroidetes bacterium]|nr:DUF4292 domain-containing protein [Bacteroidota bacterium]
MRFPTCIVTCSFLVFVGCAPEQITQRFSYTNFLEIYSTRSLTLSPFFAEGKLTVETPSFAHTGSFTVYLKRPDTLFLLIQGPFGLKIGSGLFTPTSFMFYNSIQNQLITGAPTIENLSRIFHIPLTFNDLLDMFVGGSLFTDDRRPPDDVSFEPELTILTYSDAHGIRKYWIDNSTHQLHRVQIYNSTNSLLLEQTYKNFHDVQSTKVPYSIQVVNVPNNQRIALSYSTVSTQNHWSKSFQVTYPENAERIRW